ncbi:exopolyphosphatase [Rhodobacter capsulatus]|jgi:exopolyphosphatase/guanosine-5'-triphosphate,3'-diphosphate pyrophosphatase|uniref:exopolyphosphatase n=1 Tax=Rhodobacter capsulatus (strain ATCC BAA-309 / NBRC 16581 / SB1003) TaxID=272942 RepID=D5APK2_RHOCB|nr:exopolyphosphatase [Rhodobacter capsulatus]ADE84574.1 exopolyphosphatase [Rhodobacter capsulatus SB 1003]ETD82389.1 exopolyphosphatase [Rhodobacter capsulatus YW1]ETD91542.1 exopolyphosphatase [Rhodobacter capsulatus YW2]MDS0926320.1 exopolyphosphatase [Rhodobacter capsulatus]TQD33938.1 exopolyphosphatase [Rhodobacter capsulatus]
MIAKTVAPHSDNEDWDPFGRELFDDPSARALSRVGVVDVGSNSVRMVVFDGAARSPAYFYNEKVMAGLGQGLAETGMLFPKGRARALAALKRFALLAKGMEIGPLTCVATAAVREAKDGPAFQKQVEQETGLRLHVIDGAEEARLSAQGVLVGWPEAQGIICDIGGNSMELAVLGGGKVGARATSPLGPFRLQQVKGGRKELTAHIREHIARLAAAVGLGHERLYLVGGSWRAIARLDMERRNYPLLVLHEYRMDPENLLKTLDWVAKQDMAALRAKTGTSEARMELVPLAAMVLRELIETFQPKEIDVSSYGIREGLLYEKMPDKLRARDPLIEACRHAERTMSRLPGFGKRLHAFIEPLFGEVSPKRYRLMRAACLLHDTTWRTHPDYRAEACFDNVTRANMAALSHPERVFLGVSLLHRYKNSRAGSRFEPLFSLLSPEQLREAEILGKAMRFGAMFSIQDPGDAGELGYNATTNAIELRLTKRGAGLFGEVAEARFASLAAAMKATPMVVLPG